MEANTGELQQVKTSYKGNVMLFEQNVHSQDRVKGLSMIFLQGFCFVKKSIFFVKENCEVG